MRIVFKLALLLIALLPASAQTPANGETWRYQLTDGAALMDDCPVCDRLSFWEPMVGTFNLKGTGQPGVYQISEIIFSGGAENSAFQITGSGVLSLETGEAELTADLAIRRFLTTENVHLTNALPESPRIFPIIGAQANESPGSISRVYRLRIQAAPIRDLWFSTVADFTSGSLGGQISNGDLISSSGRVVKRNSELTQLLSIPEGDVGLDAVDVGPRGEIFFSTTANVESDVSGPITHGDLVTAGGRVYLQSAQLLSAFEVDDPDAGLDALHIVSEEEVYFSITKDIPRAGATTLGRGDILSNKGRIVRTQTNLLLRWIDSFLASPGVDAIYVWPNGEIWFSTETGFTGPGGIDIAPGDLISDQGYIVFRNGALVAPFTPLERIADFGLDALVLVSDAAASKASTQIIELTQTDTGFDLRWESTARVFQVERATAVEGPYAPLTDLIFDRAAHDNSIGASAFYRIRQW